jgi:ribosomal protein S6-L-glutamate ligase RimK-like protein
MTERRPTVPETGHLHVGSPKRILSPFESWHPVLFYAPVIVYWLLLALRHRSLTLPAVANPQIEHGGLCGESKTKLFGSMTPEGREWLAPYVSFARGHDGEIDRDLDRLTAQLEAAGLEFPLVAKPDVGCHGAGVRLVHDRAELRAYLRAFPANERLLIQHFVDHEGEAGIFYVRRPNDAVGRIFSMTLKYFPTVVGDGKSTLGQLIRRDPRAGRLAHLYLPRHQHRIHWVPAEGEPVRLVFAGNHCKGAMFRNGGRLVTPELAARIDQLAHTIPSFHFGRFDVRFRSLGELMQGEGFTIVEFNGGGSEATHIWDPDTTLLSAYRDLFAQTRILFEIGAAHREVGHEPAGWRVLLGLWLREQQLKRAYPITE